MVRTGDDIKSLAMGGEEFGLLVPLGVGRGWPVGLPPVNSGVQLGSDHHHPGVEINGADLSPKFATAQLDISENKPETLMQQDKDFRF